MCGGGGGAQVDNTVQNKQAAIARELEQDYQQRFLPYEREMVNRAMDKSLISKDANNSARVAGTTYDASRYGTERQLAGFGMNLTNDQRKALNAQKNRDRNFATMSASGEARQASANRQGQLQSSMMALGRKAQDQGVSGINQAGSIENQRNITNQQLAAQESASAWQFGGTVAGMGAAGAMVAWSDKNRKKNIVARTDEQDMNDARSFGNYDYDYKPGMSGGRGEYGRVGGMAQEMPASMSDGKQVDLGDATMVAFGAIRDMDKRLQQLEQGYGRANPPADSHPA